MADEPVYEMLWDCEACDAKGLLGLTHRFCPHCGLPQNPARRYFPTEENKVAVQDHRFVGADKTCPACEAPNGAKADFCGVCGSPLDASKAVKLVAEGNSLKERTLVGAPPKAPPPTAPASSGGGSKLWIGAAVTLLFVAVCCGLFLWEKETPATIEQLAWERTVQVEEFKAVSTGDWKNSVPSNATDVRCYEKDKGSKQVPDGETCTTKNVDQGDGTFKQVQDCKPKFKDVPVKDTWCDYKAEKWADARQEKTSGQGNTGERAWPNPAVTNCTTLGCTRLGAKTETLTATVKVEGGDTDVCEVPEAVWKSLAVGQPVVVGVGLGGGVDCKDLKPAK